jgi:hypothetical protein
MSDKTSTAPAKERSHHATKSNGRTVKISTRYGKLTPEDVRRAVESVSADKR